MLFENSTFDVTYLLGGLPKNPALCRFFSTRFVWWDFPLQPFYIKTKTNLCGNRYVTIFFGLCKKT